MIVAELKAKIADISDDCEVMIHSHFDARKPIPMRSVSTVHGHTWIVLSDANILIKPTIVDINGEEYEVIWR